MESSKFDGMYEYMGFAIYNSRSKHEWDIEPLNWEMGAIEKFKYEAKSFKTLAAAKKWIAQNRDSILEEHYK
ncbi:MAG: hypothetical protein ACQEXX_01760 [Bacillota bacterium]